MKYSGIFLRTLIVFIIIFGCVAVLSYSRANVSKTYAQSLNVDPANSKLRFEYALKLLEEENYDQAQKQLEIAYEFDKKNVYISGALSKTFGNSQVIQTEIKKTLETIARRPDYASAWLHLASLYETIGELEKADLARQAGETLRTI